MQKKQAKQAITFYALYPVFWVIAWLPFWALYRLSDLFFLFVAGFGYRRKIITDNLRRAYPGENDAFIRKIRIKFYRHFCDLFMETIVLLHINPKKILQRVELVDFHLVTEAFARGRDAVSVVGHYGNWEWFPSVNFLIGEAAGCSVYRPLKDPYFDRFMLRLRSAFHTTNLPLNSTVKEIVKLKRANRRFLLGLVSDQSPSKYELQFWTTFLTQKTPVILGPEKLCKMADVDMFFFRMDKTSRGRYRVTVVPYPGNIKTDPEYTATKWHVKQLEDQIYRKPELWLWSHKRWKYQKYFKDQHFE
jgi:Kdo2-lipid IVA lauroyltransferase/acyltransferase